MTDPEQKQSVVLVDDELMMRQMLKAILQSAGYRVLGEATNGEEGVKVCRKLKPEVVCLDIIMPKRDGLDVLRDLKTDFPDTCFIMISGDTSSEKVKDAVRYGASGFIVKPFNTTQVLERVAQAIANKR